VCERLNGKPFGEEGGALHGVVVQYGGQTPLNLAAGLEAAGVPIIGTSVASIDLAEDREHFAPHRLPGAGAAQLRAGRPRDGNRLRRRPAAPLHGWSTSSWPTPPSATST